MSHSRLISQLNKLVDPRDQETNFLQFPAVPTKFNVYNIYSGNLVMGMNNTPILNGGLFPRLCNIIGESGCGKTSFTIGSVTSAVDKIWARYGAGYSEMLYFDPENNTPPNRFMSLANWSNADFINKCSYSNEDLTLLDLANTIVRIYNIKTTCKKDYLLPSGIRDVDGREVLFLAPTFICLDSVAATNPNGVEDLLQNDKSGEMKNIEKLGTNMEAAIDAKAWTIFVRKMKPYLDGANIGLYCINHKTKEMKLSMFEKETRYLPFLGMGEKIKGGKEFIYQSFNIFDIASSTKINAKDPIYGDVEGFIAYASFVKNKYNVEGVKFPLVFDMNRGYMPELSDMEYLWGKKFGFSGAVKIAMDILPEVTFTRKTLLQTMEEYPQLGRALSFTTRYHASSDMLYRNKTPMSLLSAGQNVSLEKRLAMLYQLTDSYDTKSDISEAYTNFVQLAHENRRYVSFHDIDYMYTVVKPETVDAFDHGYSLMQTEAITPFDVADNKAISQGKYYFKEPECLASSEDQSQAKKK